MQPNLFPLCLATGVTWTVSVTLIGTQADSDPVGRSYDAYNQVFTLALVLLLAFAVLLRHQSVGRARLGALVVAVASVLLLAGNVLEFWGAFVTGGLTEKTAERLGEGDVFWGSEAGWLLFIPGLPLLLVGFIVLALGLPTSGWRTATIASAGLAAGASTALWAVSPAAAALAGVWFAAALVVLTSAPQASARGAAGPRPVASGHP